MCVINTDLLGQSEPSKWEYSCSVPGIGSGIQSEQKRHVPHPVWEGISDTHS